ncbi:beta-lactamase family protein [Annulohypoxylon maeteangense]|uniref:beta-lactamase family protein n=1 Tax=Annulohypoxylon maeteangense TaxID=1927788 RepID=UPI0020085E50|nr:beta-lactamase family protein [Annulohypoxylon maeteangense]KAI0884666.1 beta-lactamase family protein [Annulohypoxylon maeteangense]
MAKYSHESTFEAACEDGRLPGVTLVAADVTGKFKYKKAFSKYAYGEAIATDSVIWIASCTKLMSTVAVMQRVEQGKISLDEDVGRILPELNDLKVLAGFDGERKLEYEGRLLLTHSSGLTAPMFDPKLQQLAQFRGPPEKPLDPVVTEFSEPLAGKLVERISDVSLEEYMRVHIWGPLDMQHVSFYPDSISEVKARKIGMSGKDENGKLVPIDTIRTFGEKKDIYGGGAGFGSAKSYVKLLQTLCANDGNALKKTVDEMFRPQPSPEANTAFKTMILDWGLGGEIGTRDEVSRRKAGTLSWGGLPNLIWWIDREAGFCGTLFISVMLMGDELVNKLIADFELAIYERYEELKK